MKSGKTLSFAFLSALLLLAAGCTYVSPTPESRSVRVVSALSDVAGCKYLGRITASVPKLLRGERYVQEDLLTLASKNAARHGADTIIAVGAPVGGEQSFDMYRCIRP